MNEVVRTYKTPIAQAWRDSPASVCYRFASVYSGKDFELELNNAPYAFLQSPEAFDYVLRERVDNYHKYFGTYFNYFGHSRLTSESKKWRKLRGISQPHITSADATIVCHAALRYFSAAADGMAEEMALEGIVKADDYLDIAAAQTVSETVLGVSDQMIDLSFIEDMRAILRHCSLTNFTGQNDPSLAIGMAAIDAEEARERLLQSINEAQIRPTPNGGQLFQMLRETDDEEVDKFGEIATLLFAGFDTTASALGWAIYILSRNQMLQEEIHEECLSIADAKPDAEKLIGLKRLDGFIGEALRIFPPIPILSRIAQNDDRIGDVFIKKGGRVLMSVIGLHHNPDVFPDPFNVKLDRFAKGKEPEKMARSFLPFGDGRRICAGARFANVEMLTALFVLMRRFRILPADQSKPMLNWDASLRRRGGQTVMLEERDS